MRFVLPKSFSSHTFAPHPVSSYPITSFSILLHPIPSSSSNCIFLLSFSFFLCSPVASSPILRILMHPFLFLWLSLQVNGRGERDLATWSNATGQGELKAWRFDKVYGEVTQQVCVRHQRGHSQISESSQVERPSQTPQ